MKKLLVFLFLMTLVFCLPLASGLAATPPDIIHSYTVTINPEADGTMVIRYDFDYEAMTNFPTGAAYLEIGVPNRNFELIDYEPKDFISSAEAKTSSVSQVHLNFYKLPLAGDHFQFSFTIRQKSMVYKTEEGYSLQFVPGWFDFAEIESLLVKLNLEGIKVLKAEPEPYMTTGSQILFVTNDLAPNQKAEKITVLIDASSLSISDENLAQEDSMSTATIIALAILGGIAFIGLLFLILASIDDGGGGGGGGYSGGGYIGGHSRISSGSGHSSLSGGGSGGFSGRGSSCACVSCACACACAGGGRAGCSEKGYRIVRMIIEREKEEREKK